MNEVTLLIIKNKNSTFILVLLVITIEVCLGTANNNCFYE